MEVAGRTQSSEPSRDSHAHQGYNLNVQEEYFREGLRQIRRDVVWALLTAHCDPPYSPTQDVAEPDALAHFRRVVPLLDVGPPEVGALAAGGDGEVPGTVARDADVLVEEEVEDGGDLGAEEEDGGVWGGCETVSRADEE